MIQVYTDGSCWPNDGTGNGTFGFVVIHNNKLIHQHIDGRVQTTNNKMELLGVITAFKYLLAAYPDQQVEIFCDSQYVVKGFNSWYFGWLEKPAKLEKIKNPEMWHYLHGLRSPNITLTWVKGHADNQWNNLIDDLISREFEKRYKFKPKY